MNDDQTDSASPLLLSIAFAAAMLLAPAVTHAADDTAEQPDTTFSEQTMLAMSAPEPDVHVDAAVRHVNRVAEPDRAGTREGLALKFVMHRLAIGR